MKSLINYITENCNTVDTDALYDSMLDELFSFDSVGGPFVNLRASEVLKECNPTAYRCGKNDWMDGVGFVEIEFDYYDKHEVEAAREGFISDLESELSDLEEELEDLEDKEGEEGADLRNQIQAKEAQITEAKGYTF